MEKIIKEFSLREIFQIIIPGLYFTKLLYPLFDMIKLDFIIEGNFTFETIIIILLGLIVYSIDLPKHLWFFKKELPAIN